MTHIYFGSQVVILKGVGWWCVCAGVDVTSFFMIPVPVILEGIQFSKSSPVIHGGAFFSAVSEWKSISM